MHVECCNYLFFLHLVKHLGMISSFPETSVGSITLHHVLSVAREKRRYHVNYERKLMSIMAFV